jgi:hypothetical protein
MGGDILYRWGNPQVYRAGDAADQKLYGQHEAVWVEPGLPGAGHITVFNNGVGRPGGRYSTVDEFIPACDSTGSYPRPEPGAPFGPSGPCWSYAAPAPKRFYSRYMSGARRLPNGNTLICEADSGHFFEVTPDSRVVWRYVNPVTDSIRLFQGDTVPKGTWSRLNSTFRVTPSYPIERYATPALGMTEATPLAARPRLSIAPNPFRGSVTITLDRSSSGALDHSALRIFDASGRLVREWRVTGSTCGVTWDGSDGRGRKLPPAVYVIRLESRTGSVTRQLVLS